jgi:ATP-dependent RNA helicase SUPV3L1/SUV3
MTSDLRAVLGPTNTGKTHLAVERMCAHSSGMIGFPLRLLAREVYDRVVAIKGARSVGLITGEEKILPPEARWLLCTAESMPVDRDVAFVALDEAQLGADPERGHVFTDRMLRARGREETMILGSESLRPMVRALAPDAEIITRPRFSTLSYAGAKKLSRLPKRSAIVAFSAEEVYAVAEMIRRTRGGAAVVMGALSPRTRNAQVAMFQAGEVDYLVATDAVGMGLNMDVSHVAFAGLGKYDGKRQRRLTVAEMAQIAGRAGRHQRDGTFGTLGGEDGKVRFAPEEIDAIENHRFPRLDYLHWRDGDPDTSTVDGLIAALEARPDHPALRAAPEAVDLTVLKLLADDSDIRARARNPALVKRLWAACSLPDFRKTGADQHARLVARVFRHLSEGNGHIPAQWFADEIARLDSVQGDVDTLAGRIAGVRIWAYIANRADWLAEPAHWADRTRALEEKLSDALHLKLTQRFVDRRTSVLMRDIGTDPALMDVQVAAGGSVLVEGEEIGTLEGFRFTVSAEARHDDRKRLLAAAERRLPRELARRAAALVGAPDALLSMGTVAGEAIGIDWKGVRVAVFNSGRALTEPVISLDRTLSNLSPADRKAVEARLGRWWTQMTRTRLAPLLRMDRYACSPETPPSVRAILAPLAAGGGILFRAEVADLVAALDPDHRRGFRDMGIVIGALDLFHPLLLKPETARLRVALTAIRRGELMLPLPMPGLGLLDQPSAGLAAGALAAGYRRFGNQLLRIDLVERVARAVHDARSGKEAFAPDPALATALGVGQETFNRLMQALGFRPVTLSPQHWRWHGRPARKPVAARPIGAFAVLADIGKRQD